MRKKINKRDIIIAGITMLAGLFLGWLFFHSTGSDATESQIAEVNGEAAHDHEAHDDEEITYTCSMHPQIKQDKPGLCPICAMDLVPMESLDSEGEHVDPNEIQMTESALALASIQTNEVQRGAPEKEIHLMGKVQADERKVSALTARFGGRIEKLYVNYTGQKVRKGEKLGTIYSPDLINAQKELLEASLHKETNPDFYRSARTRLKLWDLTEEQIEAIENRGETKSYFDILSPASGTVTKRHVSVGDYLEEGSALFEVVDLSDVWVLFDAYENDLPWISEGDEIKFTAQSIPNDIFSGNVTYIDPFIDPQTRVAEVRVEIDNPDFLFKPEMFVSGILTSEIARNTEQILVPKSSVLWTGKRAVVYVKVPDRETTSFIYREIELGAEAGNFYIVADGLSVGEEIATNGVFKIDAAAQLAGKKSMMNPEEGKRMTGHNHIDGTSMEMTSGSDLEVNTSKANLSGEASDALQPLYSSYLELTEALANDNFENASSSGADMKNAFENIDMGLFHGDAHDIWMTHAVNLEKSLEHVAHHSSIKALRAAYKGMSDAMIALTRSFGTPVDTLFIQYCPMANNDEGANWISDYSEIRNPYFGDMMLACGETQDTIQ